MKDWQKHLVTFLVGIGAGMLLCLFNPMSIGKRDVLIDSDTTQKVIVKYYTPLELAKNTIKLDVPKVSTKEYVYVQADSTIIYRDSIAFVTLPRRYYYTSQEDIEIWHSGVDSRIDSLRYKMRETIITDTYKRKDWKHELSLSASVGYHNTIVLPIELKYLYYPKKWIGLGGKAEYDFLHKTTGIYATTNLRFGW